jgi:hypothetical protein
MPPQTPLLLVDNVFDTIGLYPGATIDAITESAGHEAFRVADYRRDRSYWQPSSDGAGNPTWVRTHLTAARGVDFVALDRGHNLAGKSVFLEGSADGVTWSISQQLDVPASGVVGGNPAAPAMAQTEEGVAWTLTASLAARAWWRLRIPYTAAFVPIVTGVMAGLKTQLLGYSDVFDDDAGGRTQSNVTSTAGYRASETTYNWRTVELALRLIGATEYDTTMRTLRALLFAKNQPAMVLMDYGTYPERGWLYQYDGTDWGMAKQRVFRSGRIRMRELGARLS